MSGCTVNGLWSPEPHRVGWDQDERQRLIHLRAMAMVGYTVFTAAAVAGFVAFLAAPDLMIWPMLAIGVLAGVYTLGVAIHRRRI